MLTRTSLIPRASSRAWKCPAIARLNITTRIPDASTARARRRSITPTSVVVFPAPGTARTSACDPGG
ncbi:MAG: hypothetical protein R3A79_25425 [Nannocystaceae bacterium]